MTQYLAHIKCAHRFLGPDCQRTAGFCSALHCGLRRHMKPPRRPTHSRNGGHRPYGSGTRASHGLALVVLGRRHSPVASSQLVACLVLPCLQCSACLASLGKPRRGYARAPRVPSDVVTSSPHAAVSSRASPRSLFGGLPLVSKATPPRDVRGLPLRLRAHSHGVGPRDWSSERSAGLSAWGSPRRGVCLPCPSLGDPLATTAGLRLI